MKKVLAVVGLAAVFCAAAVHFGMAGPAGKFGGPKEKIVSHDGNGRTWGAEQRPCSVFTLRNNTAPAQVLDNNGDTVKQGILRRICISGNLDTAHFAMAFDTGLTAGINSTVANRALFPRVQSDTMTERCSPDLDVEFTSGLVLLMGNASDTYFSGSAFVYWKPNGGSQ
jgi:hypothetical protein